jgi:hypothetical protein
MAQSVVPFDEIVAGATARMAVIENLQYLSVRDLIMHFGGHSSKTANKTWERFSLEDKEELATFCRQYRFPGPGNPTPVPVITFKGALKLIMKISGDHAKKHRSTMVSILQRYYAGDGSLLEDLEANAQSAGPVQQMARASIAAEAVPVEPNALELPFRKRRMELQLAREEVEVEAKRIANRAAEHENEAKQIANRAAELQNEARAKAAEHENETKRLANLATKREHLSDVTDKYKALCVDTVMDERARLMLKDNFLNMAALNEKALLVNEDSKPISLSQVAEKLGMRLPASELISIGQEVKKRYVERHGRPPTKHDQMCGGRVTSVNSYTEADRPLLEEVLRWHAGARVA